MKILHNEHNLAKARLIVSILKQDGIEAIVTNEAMANLIPVIDSAYVIKVSDQDFEKAKEKLAVLESQFKEQLDEDFHEADHKDIAYQEAVDKNEDVISRATKPPYYLLIYFLIIFFLAFLIIKFRG